MTADDQIAFGVGQDETSQNPSGVPATAEGISVRRRGAIRRLLGQLRRRLNILNVRVARDTGSLRLTVALRGRPFARSLAVPKHPETRFADFEGIKLNVGGGKGHPTIPGWRVVDLRDAADIQTNIAEDPLPFEDDSVDVIFTSHTLEHIYPQYLDFVLGEFYRVLRPGNSLIRILVPDIKRAIQAYTENNEQFFYDGEVGLDERSVPITGLLASWLYSTRIFKDPDAAAGIGHVHCFDYDYLAFRLRRVGFREVWRSHFRASVLPELRSEAFDRHPHDSLCVEAIK